MLLFLGEPAEVMRSPLRGPPRCPWRSGTTRGPTASGTSSPWSSLQPSSAASGALVSSEGLVPPALPVGVAASGTRGALLEQTHHARTARGGTRSSAASACALDWDQVKDRVVPDPGRRVALHLPLLLDRPARGRPARSRPRSTSPSRAATAAAPPSRRLVSVPRRRSRPEQDQGPRPPTSSWWTARCSTRASCSSTSATGSSCPKRRPRPTAADPPGLPALPAAGQLQPGPADRGHRRQDASSASSGSSRSPPWMRPRRPCAAGPGPCTGRVSRSGRGQRRASGPTSRRSASSRRPRGCSPARCGWKARGHGRGDRPGQLPAQRQAGPHQGQAARTAWSSTSATSRASTRSRPWPWAPPGRSWPRTRCCSTPAPTASPCGWSSPRRARPTAPSLRAQAQVEVPEGEKLDRVEIYLNETLLATLYQPPFVQPLLIPQGQELTYVRAVAYLADGNSSEDLVLVNVPGDFSRPVGRPVRRALHLGGGRPRPAGRGAGPGGLQGLRGRRRAGGPPLRAGARRADLCRRAARHLGLDGRGGATS